MPQNRLVSGYRLSDIAAELGVSVSTVSRALSGTGRINPKTRAAVLRIAERLHESLARATGDPFTKRMIGLFTPSYGASLGMGTSIANVAQDAVRLACEAKGLGMIFSSFGNPEQPTLGDELLANGALAGLILYRTREEEKLAESLRGRGMPFIFAYRELDGTGLNYVGIDSRAVMRMAVTHCLELGFTDIGILFGDPAFPSHRAFRDQFLLLRGEMGFTSRDEWIQAAGISEEQGYAAAERLTSGAGPRPRALICCSDRIAFGVLRAAADRRVRVPRDLAVLTIDGTVQTAFTHPPLTAVQIPWFEMFSIAARMLLDMLAEGNALQQVAMKVACKLVVRESTAGARAAHGERE